MDFPTSTEAMHNLAIIAQIDIALQAMQQGIMVVVQVVVVDDQSIELIAWLKTAHTTKEVTCRLRSNPECLRQREERFVVVLQIEQLTHLCGVHHHTEDAQVVATADVTTQAHTQSLVEESTDRRQS